MGLVHLGLFLHVIAGAVAAHAHDVIDIDNIVDTLRVFVDDRDLVIHRQMLCQGHAHLSGTHDNNPHVVPLVPAAPSAEKGRAGCEHIKKKLVHSIFYKERIKELYRKGMQKGIPFLCALQKFMEIPPSSPKFPLTNGGRLRKICLNYFS